MRSQLFATAGATSRSSPPPAQEALWYTVYAALLRAVVITVIPLQRRFRIPTASQPAAGLETAAR
jgi:hypothetical protein